tara:strand:+ start:6183 stop:6560 length:378 start_codon:yes stop_codon:yes gene_type:complete
MVCIYTKITSRLINGRKRNIYTKKNSRKKYIKSKGRMMNIKTYLKTVKTKRGGGKQKSIDKRTVKEQIIEKADAMKQRRDLKLVPFYMKSPGLSKSKNKRSKSRSRSRSTSRSISPSLPKPTNIF